MAAVVALGEVLVDFVSCGEDAAGFPTLKAQPGGAPANFLAAACAYGAQAAFIGKVGNDVFGRLLVDALAEQGIETRGIVMDDRVFTTLAFVTLDAAGDREFSFARKPGADTCLTFDEVDFDLIDQARVFHFGTLSLTDEPARSATIAAVAHARAHDILISFDPNIRLALWRDADDARTWADWGFGQADIVKVSAEELEFLWNCGVEEGALRLIERYGVGLVWVTLGSAGCYFKNAQASRTVPCPVQVQPIDTTGAGDIFGGAAMAKFLALEKPPQEATAEELVSIARFATRAASLSTERHGGITSIVGF